MTTSSSSKSNAHKTALASVHFAAKGFTWMEGAAATATGIVLVVGVCGVLVRAGRRSS